MSRIQDLYDKFHFGKDETEDPENAIIKNQQLLFEALIILEKETIKTQKDLCQMASRFYHVFPEYGSPTISEMMASRYKPRFDEMQKNKPSSEPQKDLTLKPL